MQQLGNIPKFQGDESSHDAEKWLENLVDCTESLSDAAIFRRLTTKFFSGSPAREWFDNMDDSFKERWVAFEKQFRSRWIVEPQRRADKEVAWSAFTDHILNVDQLLGHEMASYDELDNTIAVWVEEHINLGKATERDDNTPNSNHLMAALMRIVKKICEMPEHFLDIERIRRHMSLVDRGSSMERKVDEISEMVKQVITKSGCMRTPDAPLPPAATAQSTPVSDDGKGDPVSNTKKSNPTVPVDPKKPLDPYSVSRSELIVATQQTVGILLKLDNKLKRGQAISLQTTLTICDRLTSSQNYKSISIPCSPIKDMDPVGLLDGLRNIQAFLLHKEEACKTSAIGAWNRVEQSGYTTRRWKDGVIIPQQTTLVAIDYSGSALDFKLPCQSSGQPTMVGGLFAEELDIQDSYIRSAETVLFMVLSSYLAECTGEAKYKEFALRSAHCIKTWMLDFHTSLPKDCKINAVTSKERSGTVLSCYLSGMAIEGFSVLASVTLDASWRSLAVGIATMAMQNKDWHDLNGILTIGCNGNTGIKALKGVLHRGLVVAYQRNPSDVAFRSSVRSYINVQCNALLDFYNSYGVNGGGPFTTSPIYAQMIDTFVAAIGVNDG